MNIKNCTQRCFYYKLLTIVECCAHFFYCTYVYYRWMLHTLLLRAAMFPLYIPIVLPLNGGCSSERVKKVDIDWSCQGDIAHCYYCSWWVLTLTTVREYGTLLFAVGGYWLVQQVDIDIDALYDRGKYVRSIFCPKIFSDRGTADFLSFSFTTDLQSMAMDCFIFFLGIKFTFFLKKPVFD